MKVLVIDTETGGLDPASKSILSLAGVVIETGVLSRREPLDETHLFIAEPEIVADARALEVNKIDLAWLKAKGRTPAAAVNKFERFLDKNFGIMPGAPKLDELRNRAEWGAAEPVTVAGHNAQFDYAFLRRLYRLAGKEELFNKRFSYRLIDTAGIMRFLVMAGRLPLKYVSLDEAIKHFNIVVPAETRHTARGDAIATAQLLFHLFDTVKK